MEKTGLKDKALDTLFMSFFVMSQKDFNQGGKLSDQFMPVEDNGFEDIMKMMQV
jgi:hypothetical protein